MNAVCRDTVSGEDSAKAVTISDPQYRDNLLVGESCTDRLLGNRHRRYVAWIDEFVFESVEFFASCALGTFVGLLSRKRGRGLDDLARGGNVRA